LAVNIAKLIILKIEVSKETFKETIVGL
jgi:hypothetical protein